jgi:hypothetical protein
MFGAALGRQSDGDSLVNEARVVRFDLLKELVFGQKLQPKAGANRRRS